MSTDDKPAAKPIEPDVALLMEKLALEFADKPELADQARKLDWMVDILILRGHLTENHRGMIKRIRATKRELIVLSSDPGTVPPVIDVDCASLMHLCHGRCCSFTVPLSEQEVKSGKVQWDLLKPYTLQKSQSTGYCKCVGNDGACTAYDARPRVCRTYDCRGDLRVWIDFDKRIPAPMPADVVPLPQWSQLEHEAADPQYDLLGNLIE
jgi:Fe-S-cluster containining protein